MKVERRVAAWEWMGIEEVEAHDGRAVLEMTAAEHMANYSGNLHGGLISTLADSAMGRAMYTLRPPVARGASFDLKLNFIASAKIGERIRAAGSIVHAGRRTVVAECRVEGADGRLIATASATFMVKREEEQRPGAD